VYRPITLHSYSDVVAKLNTEQQQILLFVYNFVVDLQSKSHVYLCKLYSRFYCSLHKI